MLLEKSIDKLTHYCELRQKLHNFFKNCDEASLVFDSNKRLLNKLELKIKAEQNFLTLLIQASQTSEEIEADELLMSEIENELKSEEFVDTITKSEIIKMEVSPYASRKKIA